MTDKKYKVTLYAEVVSESKDKAIQDVLSLILDGADVVTGEAEEIPMTAFDKAVEESLKG